MIVLCRTICRNPHSQRSTVRITAFCDSLCGRCDGVAAKQTDLPLLIWGKRKSRGVVGDCPCYQAAIIAPGERCIGDDLLNLLELILYVSRLLEGLVVVDAKHPPRGDPS